MVTLGGDPSEFSGRFCIAAYVAAQAEVDMGIFRRKGNPAPAHPISAFWEWWAAEGRDRFGTAVQTGEGDDLPSVMTQQLANVHPDLAWDTGRGHRSDHLLVVSAEGDAALRRVAEQWLRAAPSADEVWDFASARQPVPGVIENVLDINGTKFPLGDIRFGLSVDDQRESIDVEVYHPLFGQMPGDEPLRVSFLFLDWLLGEDGVERWVGAINTTTSSDVATASATDLVEAINRMTAEAQPDNWAFLQGTTPAGERMVVLTRRPLRWIDYPLFDLHTKVSLAYADRRDDGLPTETALNRLRQIEDNITAALGPRGILVAHETAAGSRVLHYYTDSDDQNGHASVEAAARLVDAATTQVPDPGWTDLRQFS
ncbi:DUF695 domain-containing protein [Paenarthrobacter sp. UW852]|uniref:DUF695 domain-containing protein n=1 Tax=Paenarthrobacter sp. UW852 TaxID=2951989 RepID=UPI0021491524|nr:DUF695 domain-containing protein [Paenarthrobacter sp. UW852]MCR1161694.1 DUF695 domain-containing protein [Paenarthrobacter sp. UW852]